MFAMSSVKYLEPKLDLNLNFCQEEQQQKKLYTSRITSKQRLRLLDLRKELKHQVTLSQDRSTRDDTSRGKLRASLNSVECRSLKLNYQSSQNINVVNSQKSNLNPKSSQCDSSTTSVERPTRRQLIMGRPQKRRSDLITSYHHCLDSKSKGLYDSVCSHEEHDKYFVLKVKDSKKTQQTQSSSKEKRKYSALKEDPMQSIVIRISKHIQQRNHRESIQETGLFTRLNDEAAVGED